MTAIMPPLRYLRLSQITGKMYDLIDKYGFFLDRATSLPALRRHPLYLRLEPLYGLRKRIFGDDIGVQLSAVG